MTSSFLACLISSATRGPGSYKFVYYCENCGKNFIEIAVSNTYDYMWITEEPDCYMFRWRCQCGGDIFLNNHIETFGDIVLCA